VKVDRITRAAYESERARGHADVAATLRAEVRTRWRKTRPDWDGRHWHCYRIDGVTVLAPVNVTGDPR
jgi:hypothetical protein